MASPWPSGAANSTNSKPSMPIGFSNVVTVMPRFGPWLVCGCALMGGLLGDVATRHRCGGAPCIGWPAVIVSDETICKAQRRMPDDPSTAGTAPSHAVPHPARSLPYRPRVPPHPVPQTLTALYVEPFIPAVDHWRGYARSWRV